MRASFAVRPPVEDDWPRIRDLRLEMLRDTPLAYLETVESAGSRPESFWRERARGVSDDTRVQAIAEESGGRLIGTAAGVLAGGAPTLVAVYVAPDRRGARYGVLDGLLEAVEAWARRHADLLLLEVHEDNPRARVAYEHRGFVATGRTVPYPLPPGGLELEMLKRL